MRSPSKPSVLVLDPLADERDMYTIYLREIGFDVRPHADAREAWEAVTAEPPDVVVLQLRQPQRGLSAVDFVRNVKRTRGTADVPVVMITTSILPDDREAAIDAECDLYLLLPVLPDDLASEIRRLLHVRRDER